MSSDKGCTIMIMRWCNVQTNEYDLQTKTYLTICTICTICVQCLRWCVMMIIEDSKMSKIEYDLKAIMYSTYDIPHKLCNISGNQIMSVWYRYIPQIERLRVMYIHSRVWCQYRDWLSKEDILRVVWFIHRRNRRFDMTPPWWLYIS